MEPSCLLDSSLDVWIRFHVSFHSTSNLAPIISCFSLQACVYLCIHYFPLVNQTGVNHLVLVSLWKEKVSTANAQIWLHLSLKKEVTLSISYKYRWLEDLIILFTQQLRVNIPMVRLLTIYVITGLNFRTPVSKIKSQTRGNRSAFYLLIFFVALYRSGCGGICTPGRRPCGCLQAQ